MPRYVKLGRKLIWQSLCLVHHWAVQIDDSDWYEIALDNKEKFCKIVKSIGSVAKSKAGYFGGEYVGETEKTDEEIEEFNRDWERNHPNYYLTAVNCQKYARELIR